MFGAIPEKSRGVGIEKQGDQCKIVFAEKLLDQFGH
jgi:hypothetical protein